MGSVPLIRDETLAGILVGGIAESGAIFPGLHVGGRQERSETGATSTLMTGETSP